MSLPLALLMMLALQSGEASNPNPRAGELFEREPALRGWALRFYDLNGDGWLTLFEAQQAAESFRRLADRDQNGRVTTAEYRAGVRFIATRFKP